MSKISKGKVKEGTGIGGSTQGKKTIPNFVVWILISVFYLCLAAIFTWPLLSYFSDFIIGQHDFTDGPMFLWNYWVAKNSLLHLQNPFFTNLVYFPDNVNLALVTYTFTNGLISIPLQFFLNLVQTINVITLLSITFSAVGMYFLVYYLTKNRIAGLVPGIVFGFSPYVFSHLMAGHYNLSMLYLVPFTVLFFIKSLREDKYINLILFTSLLIMQSYLDLQVLLYVAIILFVVLIEHSVSFRAGIFKKRKIFFLLLFALSYALIFIYPYLHLISLFGNKGAIDTTFNNGDLKVMFGLNPLNPLFNNSNYKLVTDLLGGYRENVISLGYSVLGMATLSLVLFRRYWQEKLCYLILVAVGIILALGPYLQYAGRVAYSVKLPFFYLQNLPLFNFGLVPPRFIIISLFALSVLVGFLFAHVFEFLNNKKMLYLFYPILLIGALLVAGEFYSGELKTHRLPQPEALEYIKEDQGEFTVLPVHPTVFDEYYQTIHGKKIISGYLGRRVDPYYSSKYYHLAGVDHLLGSNLDNLSGDDFDESKVKDEWKKLKIRYFTVDKTQNNREFVDRANSYLEQMEVQKVAEDASMVLYKVTY